MIGVMFYLNWRFTLIALSIAPVLFLVVYLFTRRIKKASRDVRKKESELLSIVAGSASRRFAWCKAFAREDYEQQRFEARAGERRSGAAARSVKSEAVAGRGDHRRDRHVPGALVRRAAGRSRGQLTAGVLVVFLLYLGKMYKPMRDLSKMTDTVSKAGVGYERIQEVLETESRVRDLPGARSGARVQRAASNSTACQLQLRPDRQVLKDVSFTIEPDRSRRSSVRQRTGKTTIVSLIPRFYDPVAGTVTHRRHRHPPVHASSRCAIRSASCCRTRCCFARTDLAEHRLRQARREPRGDHPRRRTGQRARVHRGDAATATTRWSASAASRCRAASASASPSRARSSATRRF